MTLNTFTPGADILSSQHNENFKGNVLYELYTGSDFNSGQSSTGTSENSYELTAITAANLGVSDYITIRAYVTVRGQSNDIDGGSADAYFKIEAKETGGSYSDSMSYKTVASNNSRALSGGTFGCTVEWTHTLTAGEKTNGVQFKLWSKSVATVGTGESANASVTNVQVKVVSGVGL